MRKNLIILILIFTWLYACKNKSTNTIEIEESDGELPKDEIAIFRTSEQNLDFTLRIDSVLNYHSYKENKDITCCYKIGTIKKVDNKVSTVYLNINGQDTLFKLSLNKIDSIMFGRGVKKRFYIATNLNKDAWLRD
jgi:hypothetical protein